jgi:hypothetical protein
MMIPKNLIKAAIPCAAKNDRREQLNGALFDWNLSEKRLRVMSTNGHTLSALSVEILTCGDPDFSIIVPIDVLIYVSKVKGPAEELKLNGDQWLFADRLFTPIDGQFPDYRRVIPSPEGRECSPGNYDADLLMAGRACLRAYYDLPKCPAFPLSQNGTRDSAVMHNGHNDAVVVILPVRVADRYSPQPEYVGFI